MPLDLEHPPPGVTADVWLKSVSWEPRIGELWLLSWNAQALGLVVVSGVAPSFVLGWPVTLSVNQAFPPAISVEKSPLGAIAVWPSRETGIGNHLLHRSFGSVLSERTMCLVAEAFDTGAAPVLPFVSSDLAVEEMEAESDRLVEKWEAISLNSWPAATVGSAALDANVVRETGTSVSDLAELLSLPVPTAVGLYGGEILPSPAEMAILVDALGVPAEALLRSQPDTATILMLAPSIKDDVVAIARRRAIGEEAARDLVRAQFALAARSDGDPRSRLGAAIHRVLTDNDG